MSIGSEVHNLKLAINLNDIISLLRDELEIQEHFKMSKQKRDKHSPIPFVLYLQLILSQVQRKIVAGKWLMIQPGSSSLV